MSQLFGPVPIVIIKDEPFKYCIESWEIFRDLLFRKAYVTVAQRQSYCPARSNIGFDSGKGRDFNKKILSGTRRDCGAESESLFSGLNPESVSSA